MAKTIAIVQSNYIPWRGYFDLIGLSDEFVILDNVQYTRRDWRNRNRIKTKDAAIWLTIPVRVAGRYLQTIEETEIADGLWVDKHLTTILHSYRRAAGFNQTSPWLIELFKEVARETRLTVVNERLLNAIARRLGIKTGIRRSTELLDRVEMKEMDPTARIIALCRAAGADRYLSGAAARAYLDPGPFEAAGIALEWMDYQGYIEYPQLWEPFDPTLSIIDLLMNVGDSAVNYMKCC
jgi:WbqC-like protein family